MHLMSMRDVDSQIWNLDLEYFSSTINGQPITAATYREIRTKQQMDYQKWEAHMDGVIQGLHILFSCKQVRTSIFIICTFWICMVELDI